MRRLRASVNARYLTRLAAASQFSRIVVLADRRRAIAVIDDHFARRDPVLISDTPGSREAGLIVLPGTGRFLRIQDRSTAGVDGVIHFIFELRRNSLDLGQSGAPLRPRRTQLCWTLGKLSARIGSRRCAQAARSSFGVLIDPCSVVRGTSVATSCTARRFFMRNPSSYEQGTNS